MSVLANRLSDFQAALEALHGPKAAPPSDESKQLSAEDIAEAVAAALDRFTDDRGALRVADTRGVRPV